ncbi:protease inhibitor I9 family protein [Methanosarcina hadiensis]|uniref:protease inhibitor I9 family protein n=1 Tax=Methanosarcina hadiensis TaxID=3078083 RepID=UPI0039773ABE
MMTSVSGAVPVIVGFKDKADIGLFQKHGVIKYNYKYINAIAANIPEVAIEKMSKNSKIAYIEPDCEIKVLDDEIC